MVLNLLIFILLFECSICYHTEIELKNNVTNLLISNYPSKLSREEDHVWTYKTTKNNQIIIRVRKMLLFPGDEITIYDEFPDSKVFLAKFTNFNTSSTKLISLSDSVSVELTQYFNTSFFNETHIFGFNLTVEVAGYCTTNNTDRVSCESSVLPRCFSNSEDRCDKFWDCPVNGLDEIGCSCTFSNEIQCGDFSHTGKCYSLHDRCDGFNICDDRSDEKGCLERQCSLQASRFLCLHLNASTTYSPFPTGECIPLSSICDDILDCSNGADEAPELCQDLPLHPLPSNNSSTNSSSSETADSAVNITSAPRPLWLNASLERRSRVAQQFATLVAKVAIEDAMMTAASKIDSRLRTLLTYVLSALLGPLLIVLTVGLMCRSNAASANAGRRSAEEARRARQQARYNSPIQRLIREEIRRRPPPPTYEEALNNSLFEEPILEGATLSPLVVPQVSHGALSQDRIAAVREMSMKPAPARVDVAVSCDLLGHGAPTNSRTASSRMSGSPNFIVIDAVPRRHLRREASSTAREDQVDGAIVRASSSSTATTVIGGSDQQVNALTNATGLLHRWFLSALGGLRRNAGSGGNASGGANGSINSSNSLHHGSSFEQPEFSEATVVSSMHEEEEEEDGENGDHDDDDEYGDDRRGRDEDEEEDDDYGSISSSRRNSVDSQSDGREDDRHAERRGDGPDAVSSNSTQSTSLPQEGSIAHSASSSRIVLPRSTSNEDGSEDVEHFPGPRTPLLQQNATSSGAAANSGSQQQHFSGNY